MAKTVKKAETPVKTPEVKTTVAVEAAKTPAVPETKPAAAKEVKPAKTSKTAPKKATKKPVAKKTTKAAPKTAASTTKVYVEYQGRQMDLETILDSVKVASGKKRFQTLEVYVKPEDGAAYYVVNGKDSGKAVL